MNHPVVDILSRMEAAGLPPATERIAMRLLTRTEQTPSGHVHVILSWETFSALCGRTNRNSARRHLTALAKAALIRYTTDDASLIHITWLPPETQSDAAHGAYERPGQRVHAPVPSRARKWWWWWDLLPFHRGHFHHHPPPAGYGTTAPRARPASGRRARASRAGRGRRAPHHRGVEGRRGRTRRAHRRPLYRLRHGITPVDAHAVLRAKRARGRYEIPEEYADVITG